ncbi:Glucoamylase (modular protein) [Shewanella benthica]|uniref:Glucoamylase (Modular protein) n=1 Tax=Shewanella benthica TaxID=43661 RepID=A0A330M5Y5_9GAMM|nr:Glucoamylase (modular protein) [Shewanella benthica]
MGTCGKTGIGDVVSQDGDLALIAYTNEANSSVMTVKSDLPFIKASTGFVGVSYGLTDIKQDTYVQGMESSAYQGLMLPEQVWDSVGDPSRYRHGQGTNSATPLAWPHAECVKLVRSLTDKRVWDHCPVVDAKLRY